MNLGWKLPLERLSSSSLGLAIQCPEQFRQRYIVRPKDSDVMFGSRFIGIVEHRVNEEILRMKQIPLEPKIDVIYREAWNEAIDKHGEPDWRDDDPVKLQKTGVQMMQLYHNTVEVKPVAMEERFEVKVPGVPVPIVGYLDVIERDKIRELKTVKQKTVKPKPKWRFQGMIYQFATGLPIQWDVLTRQATPQLYLADFFPDLFMKVGDMKVTEQLIRDAARRVNDLYAQYGPDNHWPMEGIFGDWLCDYCVVGPKYERTCPLWINT
jgi:hypothetical protein